MVPNVSWGLLNHEADILIVRKSGWIDEIEIKITASDLRCDQLKNRGRGHMRDKHVHKLWFCIPEKLAEMPEIPERAGILSVVYNENWHRYQIKSIRGPKIDKDAVKPDIHTIHKLLRLGVMRIWSLKAKLRRVQKK